MLKVTFIDSGSHTLNDLGLIGQQFDDFGGNLDGLAFEFLPALSRFRGHKFNHFRYDPSGFYNIAPQKQLDRY